MNDRRRKIRFGALIFLVFLGAASAVGLAIYNKLRDPKEHYFVRYMESVSGLEVGTTVRMKGVNVGQAREIDIDKSGEGVVVTLALNPGTPITVDTQATLTPLGVTGLKFIELSGGTSRSARITPDTPRSIIRPGASVLKILMKHGGRIVAKAALLNENLSRFTSRAKTARVAQLKHNTNRLFDTLDRLRQDNSSRLRRISRRIDRVTRAMDRATRAIRRLEQDVDQQLPGTRRAALAAARDLERAVNAVQLEQTGAAVERTANAARRRAATLTLESTAATFAAAGRRLATVSEQLTRSLTRNDAKWTEVKQNLREAGRFIKQLKERYAK